MQMSKSCFIFFMLCIAFCIGLALMLTIICVTSAFFDWKATLYFNDYHEGIFEAVLFPLVTILAIVGAMRMSHREGKLWKVKKNNPTSGQIL